MDKLSICSHCNSQIYDTQGKHIDKNGKESHSACYAKWVEQRVAEGIAYYESKRRKTNAQVL